MKIDLRNVPDAEVSGIDLANVDITVPAPETEPQRQYYFMALLKQQLVPERAKQNGKEYFFRLRLSLLGTALTQKIQHAFGTFVLTQGIADTVGDHQADGMPRLDITPVFPICCSHHCKGDAPMRMTLR